MSNIFSGKNLVIALLVGVIVSYAGFVGISVWNKDKPQPGAPELVLNKPEFQVGDQIQIKVKHNRGDKYTVNWSVLDGYNFKTDYSAFGDNDITFGSGSVHKIFLVICNVNYLVDGEIKSYNLYVQVKIGNGPLPPPPPGPNPEPEPTTPLYQSLKASFQLESPADRAKINDLAALYEQAAQIAKNDQTLTMVKQLRDKIVAARKALIQESLPKVRAAIVAHLDTNLPTAVSAPLDEAIREKARQQFIIIAQYLKRLS